MYNKRIQWALNGAEQRAAKLDKLHKTYTFSGHFEEVQVTSEGWAHGNREPSLIAYGNWNKIYQYDENDLFGRLGGVLEKLGCEITWSDTVSTCDSCYKLIETKPNHYGWKPQFVVGDGGITCAHCIEEDPESYIESMVGDSSSCITLDIDLSEHGFELYNEDSYESGWHPGQNDNPAKVAKELEAKGIHEYVFVLDENSQFYSKWSVWVRKPQSEDNDES